MPAAYGGGGRADNGASAFTSLDVGVRIEGGGDSLLACQVLIGTQCTAARSPVRAAGLIRDFRSVTIPAGLNHPARCRSIAAKMYSVATFHQPQLGASQRTPAQPDTASAKSSTYRRCSVTDRCGVRCNTGAPRCPLPAPALSGSVVLMECFPDQVFTLLLRMGIARRSCAHVMRRLSRPSTNPQPGRYACRRPAR